MHKGLNMKFILKIGLLIALATSIHALAGDAGTALKADVLRAEPFADAKTVGNINKNDTLEIITKKGAWLQVKSKTKSFI
jgi:uncharacterized protein YgiM (DUF1202 family)